MAQIAQQDELRVEFAGAFSAMDDTTKALLNAKKKQGIIYDVIIKSSTEGESRVLAVADTVVAGAITKTEITVVDATTGIPEKVTIFEA